MGLLHCRFPLRAGIHHQPAQSHHRQDQPTGDQSVAIKSRSRRPAGPLRAPRRSLEELGGVQSKPRCRCGFACLVSHPCRTHRLDRQPDALLLFFAAPMQGSDSAACTAAGSQSLFFFCLPYFFFFSFWASLLARLISPCGSYMAHLGPRYPTAAP